MYEISIAEIMLNAAALEFVLSTDELIFESLAPSRARRLIRQTRGFMLPPDKTWSGLDRRSVVTVLGVLVAMALAALSMAAQLSTLHDVRAAICGGDTEFVYAIDGLGLVNYACARSQEMQTHRPPAACHHPATEIVDLLHLRIDTERARRRRGVTISLPWKFTPMERLSYPEYLLETLLAGEEYQECPPELCYDAASLPIPIALTDVRRPKCCVATQTRQASITGGRFSLRTKAAESVGEAADFYNPACADSTVPGGRIVYYVNLLVGALGDELRTIERASGVSLPCGGLCVPEAAVCKKLRPENTSIPHPDFLPGGLMEGTACRQDASSDGKAAWCPTFDNGYSCTVPTCDDIKPFCGQDNSAGVRARQICPTTCGCADLRSELAVFGSSSGCPSSCTKVKTPGFYHQLATTPCVDVARNDTKFLRFLDE